MLFSSPALATITQNPYKLLSALALVNNLTQSIMAKAFRGELTAQWRAENPELISGENSAAELLEKKAGRVASTGKKLLVENPEYYFIVYLNAGFFIVSCQVSLNFYI